jgi:hypothetical protein
LVNPLGDLLSKVAAEPLRNRSQDLHLQSAGRGREVELLLDGNEGDPPIAEVAHQIEGVTEAAGEAIELVNHQDIKKAGLCAPQHLLEDRTLCRPG